MTKKQIKDRANFRFDKFDLAKWKKKAKKHSITLTEYLTRKANDDNDKHLFI